MEPQGLFQLQTGTLWEDHIYDPRHKSQALSRILKKFIPSEYIIIIIGIQPLGRFGQRPELSQSTVIALVRCILGKFLGVVCHCFPPHLDLPTFATRCLDARDPSGGRWNCGQERCPVIFAEMTTATPFRDLLHAANLRHGTDGFTSPPKEGVLRIFSPLKIRQSTS